MHIRLATEGDLPGILEIERQSFPERKRWDIGDFRQAMRGLFLVAVNRCLSGFLVAGIREESRTAVILRIAVHPDQRNRGTASLLIETAIGTFRKEKLLEAEIDVEIVKRSAIRLYERSGFRTVRGVPMGGNNAMSNENGSFFIMKMTL